VFHQVEVLLALSISGGWLGNNSLRISAGLRAVPPDLAAHLCPTRRATNQPSVRQEY
jgi:hypothetical protein